MTTTDANRTFSGPISRERQKKTGEVFTPDVLIEKMWNKALEHDPELFKRDKTFFEPAAGDGNIIMYVVRAKMEKWTAYFQQRQEERLAALPFTPTEDEIAKRDAAVRGMLSELLFTCYRNTYACEYMQDNVAAIKARLLEFFDEYPHPTDHSSVRTAVQGVLNKNIAHCNTLDPWDTTEGREWPMWLLERTPPESILELYKRSKHVKAFKKLERIDQADELHDIVQIAEYLLAEEKAAAKQQKQLQM